LTIKTLVLTISYSSRASYYDDLLDAFIKSDTFDCHVLNIRNVFARQYLEKNLKSYDLVVLLHSCTADNLFFLERIRPPLQARTGKLVSFIGNEYNSPFLLLSDKIALLKSLSPDIVVTQLLCETGEWLYEETKAKVISLPHALNPDAFYPKNKYESRPISIGFRGSKYPGFLGDNNREAIVDYFTSLNNSSVKTDISYADRLNRQGWSHFLNTCKATISVETGTNFLERDDKIIKQIKSDFEGRTSSGVSPNNLMKEIAYLLPYSLRTTLKKWGKKAGLVSKAEVYENIDFPSLHERYFSKMQPSKHSGKAISSRHFDAIGTETVQIMFPGRFNDILKAGEHYIALERDFSNIEEVLEKLADPNFCQSLTRRTRESIMDQHTFAHRLRQLSSVIQDG